MSYRQYKKLDLPAIDKEIMDFWEQEDVFKKSVDQRDEKKPFVFYEGPPSANGLPGIHHVIGRTIKDVFCRYKTLKGFQVKRKGGWDTHGLPVELKVEKELGIRKDDIGTKISVEDYNAKCKEAVLQYKQDWDNLTRSMGYWVDLENPYITFERDYMESLWWLLKQLYDKGLLYKGYTIQPYSPAAGSGLSSHELSYPGTYRDVTDTTVTAQFKAVRNEQSEFLYDSADEEVFFLAWTTTPWTLPSNTALTVGGGIDYVKIKTYNPYTFKVGSVIMAKALMGKYFKPENAELPFDEYEAGSKQIPYQVVAEYKGSLLEGLRYEQLLPYAQPDDGDAFVVITGAFVTTEDGTGIVHTAPSFGSDDMMVAKQHGLGSLTLVNKSGRFIDSVTDFAGRAVKNYDDVPDAEYRPVDVDIAIKLKEENKAFNVQKYVHSYPHCWRTNKPVLYYPLDSWFIKTTAVKDRLIALNKTINWKPESTGSGRFGNWLENLVDWNLSRSRYWGTPLPIWRTEDGEEEICIGSFEDLQTEVKKATEAGFMNGPLADDFDLHRPYVDDVFLVSPSGKKMFRETDLIDVWFDSGAMPYAQLHYPFENKEAFENNFPADFIAEGVDQTRGWFFTLHAISTLLFDSVAYKNVVSNGLVLDEKGEKMSKSKGNVIFPADVLPKYGVDATRWYILHNSQPWDNLKFDLGGVQQVQSKLFSTLYNIYNFYALYANIDGFLYKEEEIAMDDRPEIDRWIISLLNSLVKEVDAAFEEYEPTRAARAIQSFVDEHLSNWYVRLCRRRFWKGEYGPDKIAAYQTLYTCMDVLSKLMSPIAPFFSDWLYRNLDQATGKEGVQSVHLADFPAVNEAVIDSSLEERMQLAQDISSMVLSLRKREEIKVRQPLGKILLPVLDQRFEDQVKQIEDLVLSETNIKEIEYVSDASGVVTKKIKPNFRELGKKLGPKMKAVNQHLAAFTQDDIVAIERNGSVDLDVDGEIINLTLNEVEISSEDIPGWLVITDKGITVALDITISEDLKDEGNAREFVNRVQNLRKEKDFDVTDRIQLRVEKEATINAALINYKDYICTEVLAAELSMVDEVTGGSELEVNGIRLNVSIQKN